MPITHLKVSEIAPAPEEEIIDSEDWNADHVGDAEDIPYDNTTSELDATDVQAAIDVLASVIEGNLGPGLAATFIGGNNAQGGTTITVTKPVGTQDGDLVLFLVSGHNVIPNAAGPTAGGGAWTQRLRFDTDGNEWIAVYSKIAASEGASWSITTNSSSSTLSSACAVVFRGPTTLLRSSYADNTLTSAAPNGATHGHEIICWLSALAAGSGFSLSDPDITTHHVFTASGDEGAYMVASRQTRNVFPCPVFVASGGGMASTWAGVLAMIWE